MIENALPDGVNPSPEESNVAPAQEEKSIAQSHATHLVKDGWQRGHKKGFEAGYQKALDEIKSSAPDMTPQPQQQPFNNGVPFQNNAPNPNFVTVEQLQEIERQKQQVAAGQRIMHEMETKKVAARQELPDFDKHAFELNLNDPNDPTDAMMYIALNDAPGGQGAHLLYDMGMNPKRYSEVAGLLKKPAQLQKYLKDWGDSIKQNKEAEKINFPKEPIGQIKSNLTMTGNGSKLGDRLKDSRFRM